jgi:hypothetical protein
VPTARNVTALSQMEQSARVGGGCSQVVPIRQRRGRRRRWLLRHASERQVRLQFAADRAASKHFRDSRNRGKAGPRTDRSRRRVGLLPGEQLLEAPR